MILDVEVELLLIRIMIGRFLERLLGFVLKCFLLFVVCLCVDMIFFVLRNVLVMKIVWFNKLLGLLCKLRMMLFIFLMLFVLVICLVRLVDRLL